MLFAVSSCCDLWHLSQIITNSTIIIWRLVLYVDGVSSIWLRLWHQLNSAIYKTMSLLLCNLLLPESCLPELQGVVLGVFDSLLSCKECFQSLPTSTGTKMCRFSIQSFPQQHRGCNEKKCTPSRQALERGTHSCKKRSAFVFWNYSKPMSFVSIWLIGGGHIAPLISFCLQEMFGGGAMMSKFWIRQGEGSSGVQSVWR